MAETTPAAPPVLRRPQSPMELFRVFNRLALQGFGGVLPIAHRELVEREQWLSPQGFIELLALGQVLPGPNIINLALIFGDRHFGLRGACAAIGGLLLAPMAIVLALSLLYRQFADQPLVASALRGMGVVAAGLVISTAVKLVRTLDGNPLGKPLGHAIAGATLLLVGVLRWPMVYVVLGLGGFGMALAWQRLRAGAATR